MNLLAWIKKYYKHIIIGAVGGILNGLFGAGGGSVIVPAMEKFLNIDEKKSHATAIGVILVYSIISSIFYIQHGFFDPNIWWQVTLGGVIGGLIGAKALGKISKKLLKIVFGIVIVITSVKMIF